MVKNPPASTSDTGDTRLIPGSGRSPGGGIGNPFQRSCLENPMDRGTCPWDTQHYGGLFFIRSQRVRHDSASSAHAGRQCVYVNPKLELYPSPALFVLLQWSGTRSIISGFCPHPLPTMAASSQSSLFPSSLPASSVWLK